MNAAVSPTLAIQLVTPRYPGEMPWQKPTSPQ
ncbi:hypothetical protein HDG35_007351 [Paraburkholderia sp. JPY681]|nr:hypothetical protein [Paraburkholderia atlantica]